MVLFIQRKVLKCTRLCCEELSESESEWPVKSLFFVHFTFIQFMPQVFRLVLGTIPGTHILSWSLRSTFRIILKSLCFWEFTSRLQVSLMDLGSRIKIPTSSWEKCESVMCIKHKVKVYFKVFNSETAKNCLPSHCMSRNKKKKSENTPQGFCNCVSALMTTAIQKQMTN